VQVRGELVGRGFAVEVEDRGLGIAAERLEQINRDLAEVPAFDLAESDRLGLFITGRLADRHHISVSLHSSPYGGTTAIVIIPTRLVVPDDGRTEPLIVAGRVEPSRPVALGSGALQTTANAAYGMGARHGRNTSGYAEDWNGHRQVAPPYETRRSDSTHELDVWTGTDWWTKPSAGIRPAPGSTQQTYADRRPAGALPVRVPQASLAPQLRGRNSTPPAVRGAETPLESAEAARTSMSALQQGWERGRSAPGGPPTDSDRGRG
jgi:hypothetical protein